MDDQDSASGAERVPGSPAARPPGGRPLPVGSRAVGTAVPVTANDRLVAEPDQPDPRTTPPA